MTRILALFVLLLPLLSAGGASEPQRPVTAAGKLVRFSGKVVDAHGRPAAGAMVYVSLNAQAAPGAASPPKPRVSRTEAAADGAFQLSVSTPEKEWSATVVAVKEGNGPGGQDVRSAAETTGLMIRLTHPSFLAGKVIDRAGQPIAGATLSVAYTYRFNGEFLYLPPEEVR